MRDVMDGAAGDLMAEATGVLHLAMRNAGIEPPLAGEVLAPGDKASIMAELLALGAVPVSLPRRADVGDDTAAVAAVAGSAHAETCTLKAYDTMDHPLAAGSSGARGQATEQDREATGADVWRFYVDYRALRLGQAIDLCEGDVRIGGGRVIGLLEAPDRGRITVLFGGFDMTTHEPVESERVVLPDWLDGAEGRWLRQAPF